MGLVKFDLLGLGMLSLSLTWRETVQECRDLLDTALTAGIAVVAEAEDDVAARDAYRTVVDALALTDPANRGSGTATVCLALALAAAFDQRPSRDPHRCAVIAVNALGTDTDTIASMAAALLGAATAAPFPETSTVLDVDYLCHQADRLSAIAHGGAGDDGFRYPDLLSWTPPKTQLDAVGTIKDLSVIE
jgi:hypothetical protein